MKNFFRALLKLFRIGVMTSTSHMNNLISLQKDCQLCLDGLKNRYDTLKESCFKAEATNQRYKNRYQKLLEEVEETEFSILKAVKHDLDDQALILIADKERYESQAKKLKVQLDGLTAKLEDFRKEMSKNKEDYQDVEFELQNLMMEHDLAQSDIELYNSGNDTSKASLKQIRERVEEVNSRGKAAKIMMQNESKDTRAEVDEIISTVSHKDTLDSYKQKIKMEEA